MAVQFKAMLACLFTLLAIMHTVSGGEYCCPYYTSYGTYKPLRYCSTYCCGTSTSKYCCTSLYNRHYPSYSFSSLCPSATRPTTTTVSSGEYCCAYYTSSGSYRSSFYCSKYCCGTSTSKYCCTSSYSRYYRSYSYLSSCPTPSNNWSSWSSWTSSTTSGIINVAGAIVGSVVGFIALCVIIGVVICCATGCCGQRRGTVTRPPGNGIVMMNTPPTTQGYPVGYAPPPNTAYGPGIPQPNAAYGPGTQPPYTGYGPGIPPQQPPNTEFGPGIPPPQPPNTGFGPGIPPPNNPFGPGSPPNAEAAPLDAAKGTGNDAPPPPYPGTDDTYTALQR